MKASCIACSLLCAAASAAQPATNTVPTIKGQYVIDVRTAEEWQAGHIEGAIHIPYDQMADRIAEVTRDKAAAIALYCRSGRRSGIALKRLKELGYTNVENLGSLQDAQKKLTPPP